MLTLPYKVLISLSALLLLAAVGYRATDLLGDGEPLAAVESSEDEVLPPSAADFDPLPPAPAAERPPPRQSEPEPEPAPPPVAVSPPAAADAVPTLVIGRQPDEPRQNERDAAPATPMREAALPTADADPAPENGVYVVTEGDSLQKIARVTLGDANRWSQIAELNPGLDPLRLQVGDRLALPPEAEGAAVLAVPPPAAPAPVAAGEATHVVRPGDSLSVIALRYYGDSTRWKAIYEANRDAMKSPDDVAIGVELRIPPSPGDDR